MTQTFPSELLVVHVEPPDGEAASVTVSSGKAEVTVFCHPCDLRVGQRIRNRLTALDVRSLQAPYGSDWPEDERERLVQDKLIRTGHYQYVGSGTVVDARQGLVLAHGFILDFGDAPEVDHVEFDVIRLDCDSDGLVA